MKKLFIPIFIALLTLTILNVSKIDTQNNLNEKLSSLITSADARGEGNGNCFVQEVNVDYWYYQDECNWAATTYYSCNLGGGDEYICYSGTVEEEKMDCVFYSWGSPSHSICPF